MAEEGQNIDRSNGNDSDISDNINCC